MNNSNLTPTNKPRLDNSYPSRRTNPRSGSTTRFGVLFAILVIGVAAIYGGQIYLDAQVPKGSDEFKKVTANNPSAPTEEKETGIEIITGIFSGSKPSKEMVELKSKTADEVEFTYEAIDKMTLEELTSNIGILSKRLVELRGSLPPSIAGASAGGPPPKKKEEKDGDAEEKVVTVLSLALPLEVMRQIAEQRK